METDESASHQTLEKTASTVQIASTTVERTTTKAAPEATGRTAWDALVDMGGMLGRYTPWIIIVAGVVYGAYKFTELESRAQAEAKKEFQDEIDKGHQELRETYKQIGDMHSQQLSNLSAMLNLSNEQTKRLNTLKEETRTTEEEAKTAKEAADNARASTLVIERQRASAQQSLEKARRDLEAARQESEKNQDDLKRRQTEFGDQAAGANILKEKLIGLAKRLVASTDSSVATLGREILKEFPSFDARTLLAAYAKQPAGNTAAALKEFLGSKAESLETILLEPLGFAFWQKYSMKDGTKTAYVGVVRQTHDTDEGVVLLDLTENKIVDVQVFPRIVSVALWDSDDWNKSVAYNVYVRPTGDAGMDRFAIKTDRWTIPDTETDFIDQGPPKKIFGVEKPLYFMKLEDFKKQTEIFEAVKASNRDGFVDMVAMLENEKGFDANKAAGSFTTSMPKGLRELFLQALTESVKRAKTKSLEIASSSNLKPEVYGRIAAVALKPGFKIQDAGPSPASAVASTKTEAYFILCEYRPVGEEAKHARLTFTHDVPDGKWMLLSFENPVVPLSASAE